MIFQRTQQIFLSSRGVWFNLKCGICDPFAVRHSFRSIWRTWLQHLLSAWQRHRHICFQLRCLQKINNQCKNAMVNLQENSRCEILSSPLWDELDALNVYFTSLIWSASEYKRPVESESWHRDFIFHMWSQWLEITQRYYHHPLSNWMITTESNSKRFLDQHKCITSFWNDPKFACFPWWWNTWLFWGTDSGCFFLQWWTIFGSRNNLSVYFSKNLFFLSFNNLKNLFQYKIKLLYWYWFSTKNL